MHSAFLLLNLALLGNAIALPLHAQPTLYAQAEENVDVPLLVNSAANFVRGDRYQTQSQMQVNATCRGVSTAVKADLNVTAQYPDRIRAEVTIQKEDGTPDFPLLVVVQGDKVWEYRSDRQQYAALSLEAFKQSGHGFLIGLTNIFFLEAQESIKAQLREGVTPTDEIAEDLLADVSVSQTASPPGDEYTIYHLQDNYDIFTSNIVVRPRDETIQQIDMTLSLDETYKLEVSDKITARQENPAVTDETFSFSPTAEMTEVSFEQIYPTNLFGDDCF